MSAWTTERREKMSALMRERKPWLKSTGPVTAEGKRRASFNGRVSKLKRCASLQTDAPPALPHDPSGTGKVDDASNGLVQLPETKEQMELREYRVLRASMG